MKKMSPTSVKGASHVKVKLFIRTGEGALTTAEFCRSRQLRNMVVLGALIKRPTPACGSLFDGPPPRARASITKASKKSRPSSRTDDAWKYKIDSEQSIILFITMVAPCFPISGILCTWYLLLSFGHRGNRGDDLFKHPTNDDQGRAPIIYLKLGNR